MKEEGGGVGQNDNRGDSSGGEKKELGEETKAYRKAK